MRRNCGMRGRNACVRVHSHNKRDAVLMKVNGIPLTGAKGVFKRLQALEKGGGGGSGGGGSNGGSGGSGRAFHPYPYSLK